MAFNLLELVSSYFTPEFARQASNNLDENSSNISRALSAVIPVSLAGIVNKATSGEEWTGRIADMAKDASGHLTLPPNLTDLHDGEKGSAMMSDFFGNEKAGIISGISQYAGIKESSTAALMRLGLPAVMGILGKYALENNLTASGLTGFLSSQKDHIAEALPTELTSLAGLHSLGGISPTASGYQSSIPEIVEKPGGGPKWLLPLVAILLVIGLLVYLSRSCNQSEKNPVAPADSTETSD